MGASAPGDGTSVTMKLRSQTSSLGPERVGTSTKRAAEALAASAITHGLHDVIADIRHTRQVVPEKGCHVRCVWWSRKDAARGDTDESKVALWIGFKVVKDN